MVSVVQREWAAKNPRATFKTPITVEDVLNSRMIAYPFRLLQCCLMTDGGGALILIAAERARDFPQKPVYLLGTGESVETPMVSQMADFTSSRAFRVTGPTAFAEAGIMHKDVGHLMIYDAPCSLPGASFAHLRIYGPKIWALCRAARPAPLLPSPTPPRREIAPQHQWRRPFLHAFRHVRHVRVARERAPDARHRPRPTAGCQDLGLPRRVRHVRCQWHDHHVERAAIRGEASWARRTGSASFSS
jgi:hypothetical protein